MQRILLGVTGSIAVYKAVEIVRLLTKQDIEVKVVMTDSAIEFVQPLTFATLSHNPVYSKMFMQEPNSKIEHIELTRWADMILIAPATANIIAKITHGIADDLLSTLCLAANVPIHIAPAMNQEMWRKDITKQNVKLLKDRGVNFLGPAQGEQACGEIGDGRMLEPQAIVATLLKKGSKKLLGKKIVITAGPTVEPIDPVRFISNYSSGKMGYALAKAARDYGAKVLLVSGPTKLDIPVGVDAIKVNTAKEMHDAVLQNIATCDVFIATAAVADYRVKHIAARKIKRSKNQELNLELVSNPDILTAVAMLKNPPLTLGFAAETDNCLQNAKQKLKLKSIDMIAVNKVGENLGFNVDQNEIILLSKDGTMVEFPLQDKEILTYKLLDYLAR